MRKNEIKKYPAWEELTFANNFMFCKIMETEPTRSFSTRRNMVEWR